MPGRWRYIRVFEGRRKVIGVGGYVFFSIA
jgi:hypothetical protein